MYTGKFIVFEGGEGSGKTQHVNLTKLYLQQKGHQVVTGHEPGGTELGKRIRELLLENPSQPIAASAELFLFLSDRAQHVAEIIEPTIRRGDTMICDRFSGSTFAYQIGARGLQNPELIHQMEQYSRNDIIPDLVIYLDVDPSIGLQRKGKQLNHQLTSFDKESIEFHEKVRQYFQKLAANNSTWKQLDANRSIEVVQAEINLLLDSLWTLP